MIALLEHYWWLASFALPYIAKSAKWWRDGAPERAKRAARRRSAKPAVTRTVAVAAGELLRNPYWNPGLESSVAWLHKQHMLGSITTEELRHHLAALDTTPRTALGDPTGQGLHPAMLGPWQQGGNTTVHYGGNGGMMIAGGGGGSGGNISLSAVDMEIARLQGEIDTIQHRLTEL
jgi:hypothetical protein